MTTERTDVPSSFDERTTLLTMLDYTRKTAIMKCEGISDEDARRAVLPSSPLMTVSGVISHLRWVEYSWIQVRLLGGEDEGPWTEEDPDREFRYRLGLPLSEVVADYEALARDHDALIAGWDLDMPAVAKLRDGRGINLRWILHHLVEENARHNGHLDILRELLDGTKGD
ncbi:DinB family protein [Actinopolymorpha alba]|uniref:DinB family protein n=1 Tax=Actinopolymorpha alba TaxID=533267 RepID=UPI00037EFFC8|nr:DinB family protein [Actinopolymorpha alba]